MPRGDGTGPMGMGPITGRGAGYCAGYTTNEFLSQGVRNGSGMGRGRGMGRMFCHTGLPGGVLNGYTAANASTQAMDAKAILKNQEDFLERQLQAVKNRLKDIDEQK